jgi:hypothetical protein
MDINLTGEYRRDFISVCRTMAISSHGYIFKIGDEVYHDGDDEKRIATITKFYVDEVGLDVFAESVLGLGRISFLVKA